MSPGEGFSKLAPRVASALALGAVVLAVIWIGPLPLAVLLSVVAALAALELMPILAKPVKEGAPRVDRGLAASASGIVPLAALAGTLGAGRLSVQPDVAGLAGIALGLAAIMLAGLAGLTVSGAERGAEVASRVVFAAAYLGMSLAHLVLLRSTALGLALVLIAVVSVWADDVLAYFAGVSLGRHRLAPALSPNKTWEGFFAGAAATVAVWVGGSVLLGLSPLWAAATGLAVAVAGVFGDLAESRMKRLAGVKDSGSLLPGHGGVLDRFDSLFAVSIVAYWAAVMGGLT